MGSEENLKLKDAAISGNVDFLDSCVRDFKPPEFYTTLFSKEDDRSGAGRWGNIFHLAAMENQEKFISELIKILPTETKLELLSQPSDERYMWNPLHDAARNGNLEIVNMFLDVYRSTPYPSDHSKRPWLQKNSRGHSPCRTALISRHEDCSLAILQMDQQIICNTIDDGQQGKTLGTNIIFEAMLSRFSKLVLEILRSSDSIGFQGDGKGLTPFHLVHHFDYEDGGEEILRLLLEKQPHLLSQINDKGDSAFHTWAIDGKLWPYEYFLENTDTIKTVKSDFADLIASQNSNGSHALHLLAGNTTDELIATKIAKLLITNYSPQEASGSSQDQRLPWLMPNSDGNTPLILAINRQFQKLAMYILLVDKNTVRTSPQNVLFLALKKGCHEVAKEIIKIIGENKWTELFTYNNKNVLHLAPLCTKELYYQLVKVHPTFPVTDRGGSTLLFSWIRSEQVWLFEAILDSEWRVPFVKQLDGIDYNNRNNPFHVAAIVASEATFQILKLLVVAYKKEYIRWYKNSIQRLPWFRKNKENQGPLHWALRNRNDELAQYFLSLHPAIEDVLDIYAPRHSILFLAIQKKCIQAAKHILESLDERKWRTSLMHPTNKRNILHLATETDEEFGEWLVNKAPLFITDKDCTDQSPWGKAFEIGSTWFIKAVLKKDSSVRDIEPLAWIKACENGHVSALSAVIDHDPEAFIDICFQFKDSPLHHIQLLGAMGYKDFLQIQNMDNLINLQNIHGETPLHIAIRKENISLTETLLIMHNIDYNIKDKHQISARDLLAKVYHKKPWERMCQKVGVNPRITFYFLQHKTNLLEVRNALFIFIGSLAAASCTALFTLPDGLKDIGEAVLSKNAAFLVFQNSAVISISCSMIVLICLVFSTIYDSSKALLIDRSVMMAVVAFFFALLMIMAGVYVAISRTALWAAIFSIIVPSLAGALIILGLLYRVFCLEKNKRNIRQDSLNRVKKGQ